MNLEKHVCFSDKKIICQHFQFVVQFTVEWIQNSKQSYGREFRQLEKAFWNGRSSDNVQFLYLRTFDFTYPTWVMLPLKENSQWGPGYDHWVCSSLPMPTPDQKMTSFRGAYSQTGSRNLAVELTPWLQASSHSRNMHSRVAFWPAALNPLIMAVNVCCILSQRQN